MLLRYLDKRRLERRREGPDVRISKHRGLERRSEGSDVVRKSAQ